MRVPGLYWEYFFETWYFKVFGIADYESRWRTKIEKYFDVNELNYGTRGFIWVVDYKSELKHQEFKMADPI